MIRVIRVLWGLLAIPDLRVPKVGAASPEPVVLRANRGLQGCLGHLDQRVHRVISVPKGVRGFKVIVVSEGSKAHRDLQDHQVLRSLQN